MSEADGRTQQGKARACLAWMLSDVLTIGACRVPWLVRTGQRRVLLGDGTRLTCVGKDGKPWRIHPAFDVLAGRVTEAQRTDHRVGKHWKRFEGHAGDVVVSDAINGSPERIAWVKDQQADAVGASLGSHLSSL